MVPEAADLPGRFVRRGEILAYLADSAQAKVRVVVAQDAIGLVRGRTEAVQLRLADWQAVPVESRVLRQVPAATDRLPSPALGSAGGGLIPLDPQDGSGTKALSEVFVLDLALPEPVTEGLIGQRVEVRFDHGGEPLASQWYRSLRQLFLSHFGV